MHELDIDRNALEQLRQGVMPWTAVIPKGIDPLPYFTGRHIGQPRYGFTLNENGNWMQARTSIPALAYHALHLASDEGYLPALDKDFAANLDILVTEITRGPENGLQRVKWRYSARASHWYRGITAFPGLYSAALKQVFPAGVRPNG